MCQSRLHQVAEAPRGSSVAVTDVAGARRVVSLLAYDGPMPRPGEWLVVHSGYALGPVDAAEAAAALAELDRFEEER